MNIRAFSISKPGIASLCFTLAFFTITGYVFPWHLYSLDSREFGHAQYEIFQKDPATSKYTQSFSAVASVADRAIDSRAATALVPWLMLSPWALFSHLRCAELACLFAVVFQLGGLALLFALYNIVLFSLFNRFLMKKVVSAFLIFGLIWLGFGFYGILYVKYNFVDDTRIFNDLLKKLERVSGATPFPEGTIVMFPSLRPVFVRNAGRYKKWLHLEYNNPATRSKQHSLVFGESYDAEMVFYDTPQPYSGEEVCKRLGIGVPLSEVVDGLWNCERETNGRKFVTYAGYIDSDHSVFLTTQPLGQDNYFTEHYFAENKSVPTFFLHYFKHKDSL